MGHRLRRLELGLENHSRRFESMALRKRELRPKNTPTCTATDKSTRYSTLLPGNQKYPVLGGTRYPWYPVTHVRATE